MTFTEIAQLITAGAAVGALIVSCINLRKIKHVEHATNGMKAELVAVTRSDAMQLGRSEGREAQRAEDKEILSG